MKYGAFPKGKRASLVAMKSARSDTWKHLYLEDRRKFREAMPAGPKDACRSLL